MSVMVMFRQCLIMGNSRGIVSGLVLRRIVEVELRWMHTTSTRSGADAWYAFSPLTCWPWQP